MLDVQWALEQVDAFVEATNRLRGRPYLERGAEDEARELVPVLEAIDERLGAGLYFRPGRRRYGESPWSRPREQALHLRALLARGEELEERLGPAPVGVGIDALHGWVREAAATYWENGHRAAAVQRAAEAVQQHLQDKLGRPDLTGADLATQAFTVQPVSSDRDRPPRLRFPDVDPAARAAYVSAHDGAMHYGRGCFMAIRNLAAHDLDELPKQVAYERLAALSVFARMVQDAEVRPADDRAG